MQNRENGKKNGLVNGNTLRDILSDEELKALLEELPSVERKRREEKKEEEDGFFSEVDVEAESSERAEGSDFYTAITDLRFVNTFVLSLISEFVSSVSSLVNVPVEATLKSISKDEVFSKQELLVIKGKVSFLNIPKASYPVFLVFPRELFPLIVDSLFSGSKLSKYPSEFVNRIINSAVDWDIVKFFWSYLFLVLEEVTNREVARAKVVIEGTENNSAEVVSYSLRHSLLKVDIIFKLHIWKFPVFFFVDYGFVETCELLYKGILKERVKNWKEVLQERVLASSVEVEARIFYHLPLRKILSLKRGDVLSFSPENVTLVVNGEPKFRTKLGTVENNILAVSLANGGEETQKEMKEVGSGGSA